MYQHIRNLSLIHISVAKGRIKAPGFFTDPIIKDAYCSAEWTGPSAAQLDPTKEVEAAEKRVQGGYSRLFEPLFTEEDAIISDALNHASIIDGVRLCLSLIHIL